MSHRLGPINRGVFLGISFEPRKIPTGTFRFGINRRAGGCIENRPNRGYPSRFPLREELASADNNFLFVHNDFVCCRWVLPETAVRGKMLFHYSANKCLVCGLPAWVMFDCVQQISLTLGLCRRRGL